MMIDDGWVDNDFTILVASVVALDIQCQMLKIDLLALVKFVTVSYQPSPSQTCDRSSYTTDDA